MRWWPRRLGSCLLLTALIASAPGVGAAQIARAAREAADESSRTPNPSLLSNNLVSVSATAATNAWAVGYYHNDATAAVDTGDTQIHF